jgi:hypothetical protein
MSIDKNVQSAIPMNTFASGGTPMSTINISFNSQLPTLYKAGAPETTTTEEHPSENKEKETMRVERRAQRRTAAQRQKDALHPMPTDDQVKDRWRILMEEHNLLMLKRIAHERVRGAADRDDLATTLSIDLAGARCNTPLAEAIGLLDSEDGARGRGRAHRIITNLARTRARSLITHRDREICSDFTEMQRQAVTASIHNDGAWGKVDYDIARTINHEVAKRSGDPLGFDRRSEEFRRGSEKSTEITVGGRAHDAKGFVRIHKERSLADMLAETMRVGGLHDNGRLEREDSWTLKTWQRDFFNNWPRITDKRSQAFIITVMERAERLQTTKVRQAAQFFLYLTQGAPTTNERLVMMDIVRGDIRSLGTLVAACTSAITERVGGTKKKKDSTDEYMQVRWSTVCRMLGLDPTSSNRKTLSKLVERMAIEAGATAQYDNLAPYKSQHVRFPTCFIPGREPLSKLELATMSDGRQCNCERKLRLDKTGVSVLRYWRCSCYTDVRQRGEDGQYSSLFSNKGGTATVQGLPMYMELRGEQYGLMHDLVCTLSGKEFVPFNTAKDSFIKQHGAEAVDNYLVYGCWPGMKLRAL